MCEWQFISFVAMIIVISIILLTKVSREIFKILCALALFPSKSVHLPWALPLGVCPRSLG